jgi:hypothetical protein
MKPQRSSSKVELPQSRILKITRANIADECFNVAYKMCEYYYIFLAMLGFYKTTNANMQRSNEDQIRDVGDIFKESCKTKTSCTEPVK